MLLIKKYKKDIESVLNNLPFKIGSKIVIPLIKWILNFFYYGLPIKRFRTWSYVKKEARKVSKAISNNASTVIIVYDNSSAPPTYGDLFFSTMLARYFCIRSINVVLYFIDSEFRDDWNDFSKTVEGKGKFVDEQVRLAKALINSPLLQIRRVSWRDYKNELSELPANSVKIFEKEVLNRTGIYNFQWMLLNILVSHNENRVLDRLLLTGKELRRHIDTRMAPNEPHITIGCRYSLKWSEERNISTNEFLLINRSLQKKFPDHRIMIVSCEQGCEYFSGLAKLYNLELIYSKEYSSSYIGDGALILNSDFFFILKGGGISMFSTFSKIPFECYQLSDKVLWWDANKWSFWQNREQLFVNTDKLPHFYF